MRTAIRSVLSFPELFILLAAVSGVLSQNVQWTRSGSSQVPVQFTPLSLLFQNMQNAPQRLQSPLSQRQGLGGSAGSALSQIPMAAGKLRLLTTLLGGLRNSGLEMTIAGEILQRLIKTSLREIIMPFKSNLFSPLMS